MPKNFRKEATGKFLEIKDPAIAPNIPKIVRGIAFLKFIFFLLEFMNILTRAAGIKNKRFVAWAACCSKSRKNVSNKIKTEPPPKS